MLKLLGSIAERLPLQFRVLHRQLLLRVVDPEALSIEADIPRLLGHNSRVLYFPLRSGAYHSGPERASAPAQAVSAPFGAPAVVRVRHLSRRLLSRAKLHHQS